MYIDMLFAPNHCLDGTMSTTSTGWFVTECIPSRSCSKTALHAPTPRCWTLGWWFSIDGRSSSDRFKSWWVKFWYIESKILKDIEISSVDGSSTATRHSPMGCKLLVRVRVGQISNSCSLHAVDRSKECLAPGECHVGVPRDTGQALVLHVHIKFGTDTTFGTYLLDSKLTQSFCAIDLNENQMSQYLLLGNTVETSCVGHLGEPGLRSWAQSRRCPWTCKREFDDAQAFQWSPKTYCKNMLKSFNANWNQGTPLPCPPEAVCFSVWCSSLPK